MPFQEVGSDLHAFSSGRVPFNPLAMPFQEVGGDGIKSPVWSKPINSPEDVATSKSLRFVPPLCLFLASVSRTPCLIFLIIS